MKKTIRILAVLLCMVIVLSGCGGGTSMQGQIKKDGALRLLTVDSGKPFAYQHEDGSWQGIEIALATKVAEALSVPLEVTAVPRAEIVTTYRAGGYHLAMGRIEDSESLRYSNSTSSAYASGKLYVVTKRGNYMPTPGALAGKKVGVTDQISDTMSIAVSGINRIVRSDIGDPANVATNLTSGGLAAYLCYGVQAMSFMGDSTLQVQELELLDAERYVAVSQKGDSQLTGLVNQAIVDMTESGELAELYKEQ